MIISLMKDQLEIKIIKISLKKCPQINKLKIFQIEKLFKLMKMMKAMRILEIFYREEKDLSSICKML